ncbi:pyridoxamine 5'-phosphate oxidase [Streptomyces sp. NPDC058745]|uniref:pyridoxamine 5'-phosphate oxidase n=1 Tax=Streptomyces sp. NPDC058745 TaxID=3346621 RepID=UPI0036CADEBB
MTDHEPPRSRSRRKQDVLARLEHDEDLWVATASADGEPCLVPLSFVWDTTGDSRARDGHFAASTGADADADTGSGSGSGTGTGTGTSTSTDAGAGAGTETGTAPDRGTVLLCTRRTNPTARNLTPGGRVRLSLGHTRDVVLVDGTAEVVEGHRLPTASADAFAAKLAWDPRDRPAWVYLRVTPRTMKAWREENELAERELMRDGVWLV